ncbi:MAG: ATP-binding protein [Candidatus Dojkabacteria bacterium]|nr:ATP-binding protein [Candidatus Dojkabacteria bacterium]
MNAAIKHYKYLLKYPKIFEIFFPGLANSTRESKQNDLIIITGKKGSGKTVLAKFLAYLYHKKYPKNRIIIFSGIPNLYNDLKFSIRVNLKKIEEEEEEKAKNDFSGIPDVSEFSNSLVIFDDTERYPNPKIEKMLEILTNVLAQNGRNFNISLIIILHQLNKGFSSTTILRECDALIIFPISYDRNTFNTLLNHFGLDKNLIKNLYSNKNEKFILIRNSHPLYIFFGSSMKKHEL